MCRSHHNAVLLEYFAGEKPLRMSQINRKVVPLRSNCCRVYLPILIYCCELINLRKVRICLMLAKQSSSTVIALEEPSYMYMVMF